MFVMIARWYLSVFGLPDISKGVWASSHFNQTFRWTHKSDLATISPRLRVGGTEWLSIRFPQGAFVFRKSCQGWEIIRRPLYGQNCAVGRSNAPHSGRHFLEAFHVFRVRNRIEFLDLILAAWNLDNINEVICGTLLLFLGNLFYLKLLISTWEIYCL